MGDFIRCAAFRDKSSRFGPCESRALAVGKEARFSPCRQGVEILLRLTIHTRVLGMHISAEGTPDRRSRPRIDSGSPISLERPNAADRPPPVRRLPRAQRIYLRGRTLLNFRALLQRCQKVRTTFPTALLSSRYRVASAASDAGNVRPTAARYLPLADRSTTSSRFLAERSDGTRRVLNPMIVDGFQMRSSESILSVVPAL